MQPGLNKKLMAGIPKLNPDLSVTVLGSNGDVIHNIPPDALVRGGIGYVYERLVGLRYEHVGYAVEYRCHLGYRDRGVDLIARNEDQCRFVQCKFTLRSMPYSKVSELMRAAASFIWNNLEPCENHFDLVVPSQALAFPIPRKRNANRAQEAFLGYNQVQREVQLNIVEVPIPVPESFSLGGSACVA